MTTPNWFATVALLFWPVAALCLYQTRPVGRATIWTILGAQLFLPIGPFIKLAQGIPQFDKISIPNLTALLGCALCARRSLRFWNGFGLVEVLLLMALIGPFITSELNGDLVRFGILTLPSVGHYDALSAVFAQFVSLLPFFLGRQILKTASDNADVLRALVIAGLIYSIPMLFEVRMSPQLNLWVYGYYPSDFIQEVRGGGFRPMVFMGHGLAAAFFTMTTVIAAAALWRINGRISRLPGAGVTSYLGLLLVLCKSFGALFYAVALVPVVRWAKPRFQLRMAMILVTIGLLYPLLRIADVVPTSSIVEFTKSINPSRAASLETRFDQEQKLLERASERLMFGWGRFGRNRIYNENGRDISTTDSQWIISVGVFGLFGFVAVFGLLALPVFRAVSALRFTQSIADKIILSSVAIILAINVFDLTLNSTVTPWTWLIAGALLGRTEALRMSAVARDRVPIGTFSAPAKLRT